MGMGTFTVSLRAIGDVRGLPATVELTDGELRISAGETEIGSWPLTEIQLEETPTGYRMAAEGDLILIELKDVQAFAAELERRQTKQGRRRRTKNATPAAAAEITSAPKTARTAISEKRRPLRKRARSADREKKPKERSDGLVGAILDKARKRFGPYLPDWVFTPAVLGMAVVAVLVMFLFPALVSRLLLISGALVVVGGAVVYTDPMLASRWLPGRTQPVHVLLLGVFILLWGVFVGVLARWIGF
jgi:hypothetical protein